MKNGLREHDEACKVCKWQRRIRAVIDAMDADDPHDARRAAPPADTQPDERELRLTSIRAFDAECTIDEILSMMCRDPHDERDPIVIASEIVWKMRAEIEALKAAPHRPEIDVDGLARAIVDAIDGYDGVLYSERHRLTTGILTRHLTAPGDGGQGQ